MEAQPETQTWNNETNSAISKTYPTLLAGSAKHNQKENRNVINHMTWLLMEDRQSRNRLQVQWNSILLGGIMNKNDGT